MKILQLIPSLTDGGAEKFVVDLSNQLASQNEVLIVSFFPLRGKESFFLKELSNKITVISLNKKKGFDISIISKLHKIILKQKPDIVHTHVRALNYLLPLLLLPQAKNYKVVHTVHNDAWKEIANDRERKIRYWFYCKYKVIPVTISKESDRTFNEVYPNVPTRMIYNGCKIPYPSDQFEAIKAKIEKYKIDSNTRIFIHIGRLIPQKNHKMLLGAFKRLIERNANVLLLLIGGERSTQDSKEIVKLVKKECNERIIWLGGNLPATDYLMLGDYFCLSSIFEGMPMSLIEAFSVGCIPICTPVGGICEMMNHNEDLLSKDVSEVSYFQALLTGYHFSTQQSIETSEKIKLLFNTQYSIEICAIRYQQLFIDLKN